MKSALIVDDKFGERVGDILSKEGFFTIVYTNGLEAISAIEDGLKYDIALVDLSLWETGNDPHMIDGRDIISLSKKLNPGIPVFVLSSYFGWKPSYCDGLIDKHSRDDLISRVNSINL